jgi:hypothetical protein
LGFSVDLVDRDANWSEIEPLLSQEYEIYLANAAGNSAPLHIEISNRIRAKYHFFFAAGPEPEASNKLVEARHVAFDCRVGGVSARRRLVKGEGFAQRFKHTDAIFYVGNSFSAATYGRYNLPSFRIFPSTSPNIEFDLKALSRKDQSRFLYFGGNGLICKGLDLVLEAFDGLEGVNLDVCAPLNESDFWEHYRPLLERNRNIHVHGFVKPGGKRFSEITASAAFQMFPGSAEGCATSVVTCMRRGVIPVVTSETGVDLGNFGIQIEEVSIDAIRSLILRLQRMPVREVKRRSIDTYIASMEYTSERFESSFETALLDCIQVKNR